MTDKELAERVKKWRGTRTREVAANELGLSPRTLEGIEQGRGFRYPALLLLAIELMRIEGREQAGLGR